MVIPSLYRHNPKSLENVVYFLDALWAFLRVVYFLVDPFIDGWWMYVTMYALPTNIQVAVFMLMLLYCAQRVHYDQWNEKKVVLFTAYGVTNGLLLALYFVYVIVSLLNKDDNKLKIVFLMSCVFLVCFAFLVVGFVVYTILLVKQKHRHALFKHESRTALLSLMIIIILCLTIRCVWDIINIFKAHSVSLFSSDLADQLWVCALFLTWEIIPLLSVIAFFGKIPHAEASVVIPPSPVMSYSGSFAPSPNSSGNSIICPPSPPPSGRFDETIPLLQDGRQPTLIPSDSNSVNSDIVDRPNQPLLPQPSPSSSMAPAGNGVANSASASVNGSTHHSANNSHSVVMRGTCPLVHLDGSTPFYCFVTPELADLQNDGRALFLNTHTDSPLHTQQQ